MGDYGYELLPVRDEKTQAFRGWEYRIYRMHPTEELLYIEPKLLTRERAEEQAQQLLVVYKENEKLKTA